MKGTRVLQLLFAMLVTAWSFRAAALDDSDKEGVRALSNQAAADFEQGRYDSAREKFLRAFNIARVPRLAVWLARANEKTGRLVAAYELYREALNLQPNELWLRDFQQQAQREAKLELERLKPRIPRLTVLVENVESKGVRVSIDDVQLPVALLGVDRLEDPGERHIAGNHGDETVRETVVLAEGSHERVVLKFTKRGALPASSTQPVPGAAATQSPRAVAPFASSQVGSPRAETDRSNAWRNQKTWGSISLGVGAAGLALGLTTGILVAVKYGDLSGKCDPHRVCDPQYQSEVSHYETTRTLSTVGFLVAGVATVTGVTLLLTAPRSKPHVSLRLSPNSIGLGGDY